MALFTLAAGPIFDSVTVGHYQNGWTTCRTIRKVKSISEARFLKAGVTTAASYLPVLYYLVWIKY